MANKQKPNWHLSFEINPDPVIGRDGQPRRKAAAIARHGDLAYVAELELVNWAEDIAAFFEQVRSVFFEAEINGLPAFPDMAESAPVETEDVEAVVEAGPETDEPAVETEAHEEDEPEYDIVYYPAEGEETDPSPPSLF
jgi:hypothetical protein